MGYFHTAMLFLGASIYINVVPGVNGKYVRVIYKKSVPEFDRIRKRVSQVFEPFLKN